MVLVVIMVAGIVTQLRIDLGSRGYGVNISLQILCGDARGNEYGSF